jgi:hypothetical protein
MRKIIFKSTILLILFILANLYIALFNWKVFAVKLNIDLGFGVVEFPPFIVLFLIGLVVIGILSWSNYNIRLRKMIYELEHGMELGQIRDKLSRNQFKEALLDEKNIEFLKDRLGIKNILKKQEELTKSIFELQDQITKKPEKEPEKEQKQEPKKAE